MTGVHGRCTRVRSMGLAAIAGANNSCNRTRGHPTIETNQQVVAPRLQAHHALVLQHILCCECIDPPACVAGVGRRRPVAVAAALSHATATGRAGSSGGR